MLPGDGVPRIRRGSAARKAAEAPVMYSTSFALRLVLQQVAEVVQCSASRRPGARGVLQYHAWFMLQCVLLFGAGLRTDDDVRGAESTF